MRKHRVPVFSIHKTTASLLFLVAFELYKISNKCVQAAVPFTLSWTREKKMRMQHNMLAMIQQEMPDVKMMINCKL